MLSIQYNVPEALGEETLLCASDILHQKDKAFTLFIFQPIYKKTKTISTGIQLRTPLGAKHDPTNSASMGPRQIYAGIAQWLERRTGD